MKKLLLLLLQCAAIGFSQAQTEYKGWAIQGNFYVSSYKNSFNKDVELSILSPKITYFKNKSNAFFLSAGIYGYYDFTSGTTAMYKYILRGGGGYQYHHWFNDYLALTGTIAGEYQKDQINAKGVLSLVARVNDRLDATIDIADFNIFNYSKSEYILRPITTTSLSKIERRVLTIGKIGSLLGSINLRYRINRNEFTQPLWDKVRDTRKNSIGVQFISQAYQNADTDINAGTSRTYNYTFTEASLSYMSNPFEKLSWGLILKGEVDAGSNFQGSISRRYKTGIRPFVQYNLFKQPSMSYYAVGSIGGDYAWNNTNNNINVMPKIAIYTKWGLGANFFISDRWMLGIEPFSIEYKFYQSDAIYLGGVIGRLEFNSTSSLKINYLF